MPKYGIIHGVPEAPTSTAAVSPIAQPHGITLSVVWNQVYGTLAEIEAAAKEMRLGSIVNGERIFTHDEVRQLGERLGTR